MLDIEARSKIALLGGYVDWRTTPIEITPRARATDPLNLAREEWWRAAEPRDASGREIIDLVRRAGLGTLRIRDGVEEEKRQFHAGERGVTASEVAEHQHNKQKVAGHDEGDWRSYVGSPGDDARGWLADLAKKLDANAADNRGFFGALRDHILAQPKGATCADLNQQLVELCLRSLCSE